MQYLFINNIIDTANVKRKTKNGFYGSLLTFVVLWDQHNVLNIGTNNNQQALAQLDEGSYAQGSSRHQEIAIFFF